MRKNNNKAYLELQDIQKLEQAATNLRDRLLIRVLFHLGCRVSEALGIAVNDIDIDNGTVTIQHLKTSSNLTCPECGTRLSRRHAFCPGCGTRVTGRVLKEKEHRRQRVLPVDSDTLKVIREFVLRGGPVFRGGKKVLFGINRHRAWQIIKKCAEKAGLPKLVNPETGKIHHVSPHKLRDAFAVHAVKNNDTGDGLRLLQEHLGHASFNTTAKYRKVAGEELKEWYQHLWGEDKR